MLKKGILFVLMLILTVFVVSFNNVLAQDNNDSIDMELAKIDYELPFPGMLPDHPLYILKSTRDSLMVFFTRDNSKKAELLLRLSDKYISMAMSLSADGQWGTAAEATQQAEDTFEEMLEAVRTSKEQGVSPDENFKKQIILSNEKHREIIQSLMMTSPQGSRDILEKSLEKNSKLQREIKALVGQ